MRVIVTESQLKKIVETITDGKVICDSCGWSWDLSDGGDDLSQPCLGRTFLWTDDSPTNIVMEVYRDEAKRSNAYRARQHTGECPMYAGANVLISNVSPP